MAPARPSSPPSSQGASRVVIGLNAVVTALRGGEPHVLCVRQGAEWALPYGPFEPGEHRTFDLGMRAMIEGQTGLAPAYVEQLYTFGDEGREVARASLVGGAASDRVVSVGYLALTREAGETGLPGAAWRPWYGLFPYEDRRAEEALAEPLRVALEDWADADAARRARLALAWGTEAAPWQEERALDRYELAYEAGLVREACRDGHASGAALPETEPLMGPPMTSDHRRILATAIGRLRGKLRYRPVLFELMEDAFTLSDLQAATEGVLGFRVHKQNFRRAVTRSGLVEETGEATQATLGRPAALYRRAAPVGAPPAATGMTLPRLRD